jgi:ribosome biogenesis GTPase
LHARSSLDRLGWDARRAGELTAIAPRGAAPARVSRVDRGGALAIAEEGEVALGGAGLAVGDWVAVRDGAVAAVLPRRSTLSRRAAGAAVAEQVIAVNVDVVLVVHGLDRPLRVRRLHRALALAWEAGAVPALVLTKADLTPAAPVEALLADAALGVGVHTTSARTGQGVDEIAARAAPARTMVLLGESGAGKSRLANALVGREALATGPVRAGDAKGRHTTTARHLLPLPAGGALIDTPGLRELGLWGAEAGVARAFGDIEALAEGCRFRDCRHESEPGCAVRAAAASGELDPGRLESLRELRRELAADERRRDERARRAQGRRGAKAAREALRMKGRRR